VPKTKTIYICEHCGNESPKWLGHCPQCGAWNSYVEKEATRASSPSAPLATVQELSQISLEQSPRIVLGFPEFNRVLGGGLVPGSLVFLGGDPGIGKSTLLLQVAATAAGDRGVLYVAGEESASQIKLRAERLGLRGEGIFVLPESRLEHVLEGAQQLSPKLVIVDSIQAVYLEELEGAAGSLSQVRECTLKLMQWAKSSGTPVFLIGHVTKEGAIAGPKTLEHIVDVVLYLEGEHFSTYRILRSAKNRFGSTNEIGMFEMRDQGLAELANPSEVFLSQHTKEAIGSVVVPTMEGTRPLLVEIQALTNPTAFGLPRRTANGVDFNRLLMVAAVLSRRAQIPLGNQDIIANVAGGIRVNEPAADLGLALAIASSFRGRKVPAELVAVGEVGLSGELRSVYQLDRRIAEAAKLGFKTCILPPSKLNSSPQIELRTAKNLSEALKAALG